MRVLWGLILFPFLAVSQVTYLSGSYSVATASGSGGGGVPSLSYTPTAGTDRVLIFFMIVERDHLPGSTGDNWASNAPTGGSVPTVEISTTTLSHLSSQWLYEYDAVDDETDAEASLELMVYGTLEANIPAGTNSFNITANYNTPSSAGDEAIFGALMFENVAGMANITNSSCNSCNSISTSAVSPDDGNNAVFSIGAATGDRTFSSGAGQTLLGNSSISNASGNYTGYSEQDGISVGAQYRTGTILNSTSDFTASGAADMFGMLESAFRITSQTLLPVELISFEVQNVEDKNILTWITGSEINNERFIIQKSGDGFNWENIGEVQGMGNKVDETHYYFEDEGEIYEKTYYRLKQIDFDQKYDYSPVRMVLSSSSEHSVFVYQTNNRINIVGNSEINQVELYNINGQLQYQSGELATKNYYIQPTGLANGIYILNIKGQKGFIQKKVYIK